MKKVTKYTIGIIGSVLSVIGLSGVNAQEAVAESGISNVTDSSPLYLSTAIDVQQDNTSLDAHYSHTSHGSHTSHSSHSSSY